MRCTQVLTSGTTPILPYLEDDDKKEVGVGYSVELLVQVQGQEGEEVVLVCVNDVALE